MGRALPVVAAATSVGERADAARNRAKILAAAETLFAERGASNVSMDDIAARAGVGKGTLFRRFGDRASLAMSLLESREMRFQEAFLRGGPPLGPGAPPCERLIAFGRAVIDLAAANTEILVAAQAGRRYRAMGILGAYRAHVAHLVRGAEPGLDADYVADALMSVLRADLYVHLHTVRGMDVDRIKDGYATMVRRLLS